jgi:hypothetical protein
MKFTSILALVLTIAALIAARSLESILTGLRRLCTALSLGRDFFDPEATLHALADEILKYRRALRLLARAIGWASTGAPFGLMGQSSQQIAMTTGFWVRICASSPC